jgi:hypothetical protein
MSVEAVLFSVLSNDVPVKAVVAARIYPVLAAEGAADPLITYAKEGVQPFDSLAAPAVLQGHRMTVISWASTHDDAVALAAKVRTALEAYAGTVGATKVAGIRLQTETDTVEPAIDAEAARSYGVQQSYLVMAEN